MFFFVDNTKKHTKLPMFNTPHDQSGICSLHKTQIVLIAEERYFTFSSIFLLSFAVYFRHHHLLKLNTFGMPLVSGYLSHAHNED